MKKPIIGLVPLFDDEKESLWMLPGYMDGITEAGGIPIILPLTADKAAINQLLDTVDGIMMTGGHDVSPGLYERRSLMIRLFVTQSGIAWKKNCLDRLLKKTSLSWEYAGEYSL